MMNFIKKATSKLILIVLLIIGLALLAVASIWAILFLGLFFGYLYLRHRWRRRGVRTVREEIIIIEGNFSPEEMQERLMQMIAAMHHLDEKTMASFMRGHDRSVRYPDDADIIEGTLEVIDSDEEPIDPHHP